MYDKEIPGLGKSLRDLLVSDESNAGQGVSYGANTLTDATRKDAEVFSQSLVGRSIVAGSQVAIVQSVSGTARR